MQTESLKTGRRPPIFIVGNSRSGTTMLRLMLTCHPDICIPPEGPFATVLYPQYGNETRWDSATRSAFFDSMLKVPKMENWGLNTDAARREFMESDYKNFGHVVASVYNIFRQTRDATATRWGDKSGTVSLSKLQGVCEQLEECQLIHIVRDGRDVLCSYRGANGIDHVYAPNLPTTPVEAGLQWGRRVNAIDSTLTRIGKQKCCSVRYEDLVDDPSGTLAGLCEFLKEPFVEDMVHFGKMNTQQDLEPAGFLQWKSKTTEPVTNSQVGRWRRELSETEIAEFELVAAKTLKRFGYPLSGYQIPLRAHLRLMQSTVSGYARRFIKLSRKVFRRIK